LAILLVLYNEELCDWSLGCCDTKKLTGEDLTDEQKEITMNVWIIQKSISWIAMLTWDRKYCRLGSTCV